MSYEQINLYDDKEQFKAAGKTPEELEKDAKDEILKNKIGDFINENKKVIDGIIKIKRELGALDIHDLARRFVGNVSDEEVSSTRTLFAKILVEKGYKLNAAVIRVEIEGRGSTLFEKEAKTGQKKIISRPTSNHEKIDEIDEIKRKRAELPPHQRGLPNADL